MNYFIKFLRSFFPFLTVLVLWRLSVNFWNPAGILAIIPIFYCSFVLKIPYFSLFGLLFCFLIDYNFDTKLFWTTMFCIMYSINGFQTFTDLSHQDKNALQPFMIFFGTSILLLSIIHLNFTVFFRMIWIFIWVVLLYLPITTLIKRIYK